MEKKAEEETKAKEIPKKEDKKVVVEAEKKAEKKLVVVPTIRVYNSDNNIVQLEAGGLNLGLGSTPLISVIPATPANKANFRIVYSEEETVINVSWSNWKEKLKINLSPNQTQAFYIYFSWMHC